MSLLQLGPIELHGFELPSRIGFGGAQQLAVHKLIGGVRVIDVLGRDDSPLEWSGVLAGSDAANRARTLDLLRVSGTVQTLTWDAFCYSVVVAKLHLEFSNPWWIPYRISCIIQRDLAQGTPTLPASNSTSAVADLASAQQLLDPGLAAKLAAASSSLTQEPGGPALASSVITTIRQNVEQNIEVCQIALESGDISQTIQQAGILAQLCLARSFLDRSAATLNEAQS